MPLKLGEKTITSYPIQRLAYCPIRHVNVRIAEPQDPTTMQLGQKSLQSTTLVQLEKPILESVGGDGCVNCKFNVGQVREPVASQSSVKGVPASGPLGLV